MRHWSSRRKGKINIDDEQITMAVLRTLDGEQITVSVLHSPDDEQITKWDLVGGLNELFNNWISLTNDSYLSYIRQLADFTSSWTTDRLISQHQRDAANQVEALEQIRKAHKDKQKAPPEIDTITNTFPHERSILWIWTPDESSRRCNHHTDTTQKYTVSALVIFTQTL